MKILLVEDARAVVILMMARLTSYGHDVIHAANGQIAVDLFRKSAPDLVLMDIEMPVMNGFEATNRIRAVEATQQWAWTPVIFLTSSDTVDNLITAIEAGGDDFMAKTVPEPVLHAKMKAMTRIAALRQNVLAANLKLQELANLDGLTGLPNRRNLDQRVDLHWAQAVDACAPFGLLMLDIDNFKKYNDHYGHAAGDDCLRQVAEVISKVVRSSNTEGATVDAFPARYGGEEFAIVLPRVSDESYRNVADAVVAAVRGLGIAHERNETWGVVTLSIGGERQAASQDHRLVDVFRTADQRLYRAKEKGRNRAECE